MNAKEIREGDIVEIDYITHFTKEHRNEGMALVVWKGFNGQPLILRLPECKNMVWSCYEQFSRVIGHIDIGNSLKGLCEQALTEKGGE